MTWTLDWVVQVLALAETAIVLCSRSHSYSYSISRSASLQSTQVYKWVSKNCLDILTECRGKCRSHKSQYLLTTVYNFSCFGIEITNSYTVSFHSLALMNLEWLVLSTSFGACNNTASINFEPCLRIFSLSLQMKGLAIFVLWRLIMILLNVFEPSLGQSSVQCGQIHPITGLVLWQLYLTILLWIVNGR